jgi:DNA repair protein RadC
MQSTVTQASEALTAVKPGFPVRSLGIQECFVVLSLDAKHRPIGRPKMVAMGTATAVTVHPRDVFRQAIKSNAVAVIVAHNHPSGDPSPSNEDLILTKRMVEAGEMLGIPVLDHIVLTSKAGSWVSLADRGLL